MITLGIDPGTHTTGYGLVTKTTRDPQHLENGLIIPTKKNLLPERLRQIYHQVQRLIAQFKPDAIALEDVFVAKNVRSSLTLGHARGVVMLAAAEQGLPVYEYSPAEVKQAIVGFGRASKEQVQKMVQIHLKLKEVAAEDASDALAVALCHCQMKRYER